MNHLAIMGRFPHKFRCSRLLLWIGFFSYSGDQFATVGRFAIMGSIKCLVQVLMPGMLIS